MNQDGFFDLVSPIFARLSPTANVSLVDQVILIGGKMQTAKITFVGLSTITKNSIDNGFQRRVDVDRGHPKQVLIVVSIVI